MICRATGKTATRALGCCLGHETLAKRLWSKVDKTDACWEWTDKPDPNGYGRLHVHGTPHLAHRLAFAFEYGWLPDLVDHSCLNRVCVRPDHLRPATKKQNAENMSTAGKGTNTKGVRGVSWCKRRNKWRTHITHNKKYIYVGSFDNLEDAEYAVKVKRNELFTHNDQDRA